MRYPTYLEIRSKVERDLDLGSAADLISADEMLGYYNEAVDDCESIIHTLYEDYFLTSASFPFVSGQSEYSLPSDIYATKIRALIYDDGVNVYSIPRIRDRNKFEEAALAKSYLSNHSYQYLLKNPSSAGIKLVLFPAAKQSTSAPVLWYIRNATRATQDADLCDIPEFSSYVIQFMKVRVMEKDNHPNLQLAIQQAQYLRAQMEATLRDMVPDGDTNLEPDMTSYLEMS
jgi:hypothetical protein